MKSLLAFAAVFALMTFVGVSYSQAAPQGKKVATLRGEVVKVDGTNVVIKSAKDGKEVTVATDDKTVVTIEGNPAKVADLKAGQKVSVTPAEGTATKITVPKPKAAK